MPRGRHIVRPIPFSIAADEPEYVSSENAGGNGNARKGSKSGPLPASSNRVPLARIVERVASKTVHPTLARQSDVHPRASMNDAGEDGKDDDEPDSFLQSDLGHDTHGGDLDEDEEAVSSYQSRFHQLWKERQQLLPASKTPATSTSSPSSERTSSKRRRSSRSDDYYYREDDDSDFSDEDCTSGPSSRKSKGRGKGKGESDDDAQDDCEYEEYTDAPSDEEEPLGLEFYEQCEREKNEYFSSYSFPSLGSGKSKPSSFSTKLFSPLFSPLSNNSSPSSPVSLGPERVNFTFQKVATKSGVYILRPAIASPSPPSSPESPSSLRSAFRMHLQIATTSARKLRQCTSAQQALLQPLLIANLLEDVRRRAAEVRPTAPPMHASKRVRVDLFARFGRKQRCTLSSAPASTPRQDAPLFPSTLPSVLSHPSTPILSQKQLLQQQLIALSKDWSDDCDDDDDDQVDADELLHTPSSHTQRSTLPAPASPVSPPTSPSWDTSDHDFASTASPSDGAVPMESEPDSGLGSDIQLLSPHSDKKEDAPQPQFTFTEKRHLDRINSLASSSIESFQLFLVNL